MDRTNRTVNGKSLRIVNKAFQSVEVSVYEYMKLKTECTVRNENSDHGSYEPYGSWKGFTDRE